MIRVTVYSCIFPAHRFNKSRQIHVYINNKRLLIQTPIWSEFYGVNESGRIALIKQDYFRGMEINISGVNRQLWGPFQKAIKTQIGRFLKEAPGFAGGSVEFRGKQYVAFGSLVQVSRNYSFEIKEFKTIEASARNTTKAASSKKSFFSDEASKALESIGCELSASTWIKYQGKKYNGMKQLFAAHPDLQKKFNDSLKG